MSTRTETTQSESTQSETTQAEKNAQSTSAAAAASPERAFGFRTRALHAGGTPDAQHGARAVPIYQTTSFVFDDAADASNLFALQKYGNIYSRIGNPTVAAFEERIASLEGGIGRGPAPARLGGSGFSIAARGGGARLWRGPRASRRSGRWRRATACS